MSTMASLVRTRATAVWSVLVLATIVSWLLGTDASGGSDGDHSMASIVIVLIAFVKVRLIGLYFMELREAPMSLRGLFEGYCAAVCAVVLGMYLWA